MGWRRSLTATHSSFETPCGAYGHFKVARYLMRVTGDSNYGDSMETVLYNTILGAKPIRPDGVSFYYSDYNVDAVKSDYEEKWPCCSGTFPQLSGGLWDQLLLPKPEGIYVNLYVPSRVSWRQGDARVTLTQETQYPTVGETSLKLTIGPGGTFRRGVADSGVGGQRHEGRGEWQACRRCAEAGELGGDRPYLEEWRSCGALARHAVAPGSAGRATLRSCALWFADR